MHDRPAKDVVFAANRSFIPHLAVAIKSLLCYNADCIDTIHVIHSSIPPSDILTICRMVKPYRVVLQEHKIHRDSFIDLPVENHLASETYYRLLIPELISADKILYLDCDIVVVGSIQSLLATTMAAKPIAAVRDEYGESTNILPTSIPFRYFNAGVLLMNLTVWRRLELSKRVVQFAQSNPTKLRYADQCALNGVLKGDWIDLSPEFNAMPNYWSTGLPISIVHFIGGSKPWQLRHKSKWKGVYWEIRRKTPYARWTPDDLSTVTLLKLLTPQWIKRLAKALLRKTATR